MNAKLTPYVSLFIILCLFAYIYPLIQLILVAYGDGGFGVYESWIKASYAQPVGGVQDILQMDSILNAIIAGVGIGLFLKPNKKNNKINIYLPVIFFFMVAVGLTVSYLLHSEIILSKDVLIQSYGGSAYTNIIKFTNTKFKDLIAIFSVMIGSGVIKIIG